MTELRAFTVEGPVQAEILVLFLDNSAGDEAGVFLTGPCGAAPWYVEVAQGADPMAVAARLIRANLGQPTLVHSTSWRQARGAVVLTFVTVLEASRVAGLERVPVQRAELARGDAAAAPAEIAAGSVIEHGLRHLAWLVKDDPVVAGELSSAWHSALESYVPEPFRQL